MSTANLHGAALQHAIMAGELKTKAWQETEQAKPRCSNRCPSFQSSNNRN